VKYHIAMANPPNSSSRTLPTATPRILTGPKVAAVLEALAQLAPPAPVRSLREHRSATALAEARTCYDQLLAPVGQGVVALVDGVQGAGRMNTLPCHLR